MTGISQDPNRLIAIWTQRLTIATVALVITSIFGATVSYFQWLEIHQGSVDTRALAEAAKKQAEAATQQAEVLSNQQRPWIGASYISIDALKSGQNIITHLSYSNFGKEPAIARHSVVTALYNYEDWVTLFNYDLPSREKACRSARIEDFYDIGAVFPQTAYANNDYSQIANEELLKGKKVFVRMDCFAYKVGEKTKHSQTCYYFSASENKSEMFLCPAGIFFE